MLTRLFFSPILSPLPPILDLEEFKITQQLLAGGEGKAGDKNTEINVRKALSQPCCTLPAGKHAVGAAEMEGWAGGAPSLQNKCVDAEVGSGRAAAV